MKNLTIVILLLFVCQISAFGAESNPGEFYQSQHKKWVAQFDLNEDGWLNAEEREKMRASRKPGGKSFRRGGERGGEKEGKKRVRFDMPQHWKDKYDKDGDGGLSDAEADKGYWTERGIMFKAYDANENEKLDPEETEKLADDIDNGKYESWDHFVATTTLGDAERKNGTSRPRLNPRQKRWLELDKDGDGRASASEIMAIRKAEKK